ncbi:hypothetical protein [Loktanella sp. Alg231-35]|uniref:hypothetical protein n=1 Tax=Loktanella sp. Alg231-35 TaxID=1922220 RepID=UPI000D54BC72|nr:hypothetical protein [Loktanella sp. Alg231-35]
MTNDTWKAGYAVAFLLAVVLFVLLGVLQSDRPLWQDESAILENLGLPWGSYFTALPYNDQAAPPLALIFQDIIWRLADGDVSSMRLLMLGVTTTVIGGVGLSAIRRGDAVMLVALMFLMTAPHIISYSTELKHYIFEFGAALVLMHAAVTLDLTRKHACVVLFVLSVVLALFSFSSMFISVVIFLDAVLFRTNGRTRLLWGTALVGFVIVWVGLYVTIFKPVTFYQLTNYSESYDNHTLLAILQSGGSGLLTPLKHLVFPSYFGISLGLSIFWGIAMVIKHRRSKQADHILRNPDYLFLRLGVGLISSVVLLSVLGQYPIFNGRQLLFTQPVKATAGAAFIFAVFKWGEESRSIRLAVALIIATLTLPNAVRLPSFTLSGWYISQDTSALYEHIQTRPDIPVVPNLLFARTLRYYENRNPEPQISILGELPFDTRVMESTDAVVANLNANAINKLNNHIWAPLDVEDSYRAYTDFVLRIAQDTGRITFAAAQFEDEREAFLVTSADAADCAISRDFTGPGVRSYDIDCALR